MVMSIKALCIAILLLPACAWADIQFDGIDDSVNCTTNDGVFNETSPVTISAWINAYTLGGANFGRIVDRATAVDGPCFIVDQDKIYFEIDGNTVDLARFSTTFLGYGTLFHVLTTWDGSNDYTKIHLYVNGTQVDGSGNNATGGFVDNAGTTLRIGNALNNARAFNGTIAQVAIWNKVLNATEIASVSASTAYSNFTLIPTISAANLTAYYPMNDGNLSTSADGDIVRDASSNALNGTGFDGANDAGLTWVNYGGNSGSTNYTADANCTAAYIFAEGTGTTVDDISSSSNTGTFNATGHPAWSTNKPSYAIQGNATGSVKFNGSAGDLINCTTNDFVQENKPLTFVCLLNMTSLVASPSERDQRIFTRSSGGEGINYAISWDGAESRIYLEVPGTSTLLANINSTAYFTTGAWHQVAVTWDGGMASSGIKLYFDGALKTTHYAEEGASATNNAGFPVILGNMDDGSATLNGTMTDAAFFNRVLSASEINDIYSYGLRGNITAPSSPASVSGMQVITIE